MLCSGKHVLDFIPGIVLFYGGERWVVGPDPESSDQKG